MNRISDFKNLGKTADTLRRRRNEVTVQLRKAKRSDLLSQRRSIPKPSKVNCVPAEYVIKVINEIKSNVDLDSLHTYVWVLFTFLKQKDDRNEDKIEILTNSGILSNLVPLLGHEEEKIRAITLNVLVSVAAGSDEQVQALLIHKPLIYFKALVSSRNAEIRADAILFLLNVTYRNESEIQDIFRNNLLWGIIKTLLIDGLQVQINAVWILSNMTCNPNQGQKLIANGGKIIVPRLCVLLFVCKDNEAIFVILYTLYNMLLLDPRIFRIIRVCSGVHVIEKLIHHGNSEIGTLAQEILDFETT